MRALDALPAYQAAGGCRAADDGDGIGGTGKTFNWSKNHFNTKKPIIIAGGLNCDNVEDAIKVFLPYGVDVSSGVESCDGVKDLKLIKEFIQKVKNEK